jgi:hypothetical protein
MGVILHIDNAILMEVITTFGKIRNELQNAVKIVQ